MSVTTPGGVVGGRTGLGGNQSVGRPGSNVHRMGRNRPVRIHNRNNNVG